MGYEIWFASLSSVAMPTSYSFKEMLKKSINGHINDYFYLSSVRSQVLLGLSERGSQNVGCIKVAITKQRDVGFILGNSHLTADILTCGGPPCTTEVRGRRQLHRM